MTTPSGDQYTIAAAGYTANIASVGASVRTLRAEGRDLLVPFEADQIRPAHRGATLAPWPNRVVDGAYDFEGKHYQLDLSEPARGHAIHGLVDWQNFSVVQHSDDALTVEAVIEPRKSYPWRVRVTSRFLLDEHGLTQTLTGHNLSDTPAPWGTGFHPYCVAPGSWQQWELHAPAAQVLKVDDRLSPIECVSVDTDPQRFDFRQQRTLGDARLDHAFTDIERDADGRAIVRIADSDGHGVQISWGKECPWFQVFTADFATVDAPAGPNPAIAIEPMTCAPDAFNNAKYSFDAGLNLLESNASFAASWTLSAF